MNTDFDRSTMRNFIKAWGQMLLLLSIFFTFPVYAAGEEVAGITTELGTDKAENTAADNPLLDTASEAEVSASPVVISEPPPPPVISGESTNNAQIETTPTPQKDNDIRQRIQGIFLK